MIQRYYVSNCSNNSTLTLISKEKTMSIERPNDGDNVLTLRTKICPWCDLQCLQEISDRQRRFSLAIKPTLHKHMTTNNTSLGCECSKKSTAYNSDNGNNFGTNYDIINQVTNNSGDKQQINVAGRKRNTHYLYNCLLCNKLQQLKGISECGKFFSFRYTIMRVAIFLIFTFKSLNDKDNQKIRTKIIQKQFIFKRICCFLLSLIRLICILQLATKPAVGDMLVSSHMQDNSRLNGTTNLTMTLKPFQLTKQSVTSNLAPLLPQTQTTSLSEIQDVYSTVSLKSQKLLSNDDIKKYKEKNPESPDKSSSYVLNSCSSCHMREKAKYDSLESIKFHILTQLRLPESPNIPVPREVPLNIIEDFYRNFDENGQRRQYSQRQSSYFKNTSPRFLNEMEPMSIPTESYELDDNDYGESKSYEEMMSNDDPNSFHYYHKHQQTTLNDNLENEDELLLHVNGYYIFPTQSRLRHNKKSEFLNFKFLNNDKSIIVRTILHLYIRGRKWISEFEPDLLQQIKFNSTDNETKEISVGVHRALKRKNSFNYTHTIQMAEWNQRIPAGLGKWIQIDLKDLPNTWMHEDEANQVIIIKTAEPWMRHLVVTGLGKRFEGKNGKNDNSMMAHIEVRIERGAHGRLKRSTSLDCQESDNEVRCCRYPLKVNFTSFGWSFVVAPTDFDAYFCNGECKIGFLEQHTHTHITSLSRSASPCCAPTKMSSLTMLYFNLEQQLALATIPNMTVEKCSCS